jgi:hypothetical protein
MYKVLTIPALFAACALGQTATNAQTMTIPRGAFMQMDDAAEFGPVGITTALAGPMAPITGAPYSAQSTTERVQPLADGNRIVQTTSGSVARDSQGRVRREESLPALKTNNGAAPHLVMIDDPVAQVHWTLDAQRKMAMKMPLPNIRSGKFGAVAGSGISSSPNFFFTAAGSAVGGASSMAVMRDSGSSSDSNNVKTDLGTQIIEGVPAQGTRVTRTIPAGEFGNEEPMVITTETWYSPDLKVLVMSKSSDPRMGDTTYTLTNIQRSEPLASLFQAPDDYTVKEMPGLSLQIPKN